ncbi:MAG: HAD hydrolase-like protein [Oscillospiraceae bacterium]|nr:HAD hydrolase-like protein [Oscillospiraceae bacterium]
MEQNLQSKENAVINSVCEKKGHMKYSCIIWDWNGTLLDDVSWCVDVINRMLARRKLNIFGEIADYHRVFSFPVIDYYKKIGFDFEKEPFEDLAVEYVEDYYSGKFKLHENAEKILAEIHKRNIKQVILSASEINYLKTQLSCFDIEKYFDEILGISDIYAGSKFEIGLEFMKRNKIESALLVGDTEHDFETAKRLGADCILISNGHQSKERLATLGVPVLDSISDVLGVSL